VDVLHVDSTNIVNPARPIAEITVNGERLVEVFVSTANVSDISVGDAVELIFIRQGGDAVYAGTVYSVGSRAETMISILGVEERRVEVLILPELVTSSFGGNFDVDVRFITYSAEDTLTVPRTAVFDDNGRSMVFVVDDGMAVAREIVLGSQLRTEVVVASGLGVGEIVIRDARLNGLVDGARVAS